MCVQFASNVLDLFCVASTFNPALLHGIDFLLLVFQSKTFESLQGAS